MQMPAFEKHVWAEIDLDALRHNFRAVKARAGEMPLCAVVKADSYGHGAVECAKVFAEEGAGRRAASTAGAASKSVRSAKPMRPMPVSALRWTLTFPPTAQAASLRALAWGRE